MRAVNSVSHPAYETVIFGEPTDLKLASGHKDNLAFIVTAIAKGDHILLLLRKLRLFR